MEKETNNKNNRKMLLIVAGILLVLIVGASVIYTKLSDRMKPDQMSMAGKGTEQGAAEEDSQKTAAPDFTVYKVTDRETNEVEEVHLSDYAGKPIVLNFWASWCGPCQMEMPDFHEKYKEIGDEVQFLMVNMTDGSRETIESVSDFIAQKEYTFPVFFDLDFDATGAYSVYSLPTTFFIDTEGNVAAQATGSIDAETLQKGIDMIYQESAD